MSMNPTQYEWLLNLPWLLVAALVVILAVATAFAVALILHLPGVVSGGGSSEKDQPWIPCSHCGRTNPANMHICLHCGLVLRRARGR
jgi:hypothetical protein